VDQVSEVIRLEEDRIEELLTVGTSRRRFFIRSLLILKQATDDSILSISLKRVGGVSRGEGPLELQNFSLVLREHGSEVLLDDGALPINNLEFILISSAGVAQAFSV